jgi:primase-polymerase (primpol)-like protein
MSAEHQPQAFPSPEQAREYAHRLRERFAQGLLKELRPYRNWIVWQRRGEQKVPCNPDASYQASSTKPATWGTLASALSALESGKFSGLGFMLDPQHLPLTFIDLDHVLKKEGSPARSITDISDPRLLGIVHDLGSYTEISPSGEGLHVLAYGKLPGSGLKTAGLEMYDRGRYFTVTGEHLAGTPFTIERRQERISRLYEDNKPSEANLRPVPFLPPEHTATFLTGLPPQAEHDQELARLMRGDTSKENGDESRALFKLVLKLLHYSGNDVQFTRQQVLATPLGQRDKVLERRGKTDYLNMTIYNALRYQRNPPMKR